MIEIEYSITNTIKYVNGTKNASTITKSKIITTSQNMNTENESEFSIESEFSVCFDNDNDNENENENENGNESKSLNELGFSNEMENDQLKNENELKHDTNFTEIACFTDASYNHFLGCGVISFYINNEPIKNIYVINAAEKYYDEEYLYKIIPQHITNGKYIINYNIRGFTSSELELMGIYACIEDIQYICPNNDINFVIYTDSKDSINTIKKMKHLPINIKLMYTKGHMKKFMMTEINKKFHVVDKDSRKKMRKIAKLLNNK